MALEVRIRKRRGNFVLDMEFSTGDGIFALLGPSGCGKTMTLRCIAGIEKPDEGRILLDGKMLFDSEKKICLTPQKRRVGYMFQDYALFPNMTVRENVMAGMGKNPDRREADRLLERFRITDIANLRPGRISGGQKQRTALARLIGQRPDAILLDEPFSALDSGLRWQLVGEMKETLAEFRVPTVFVSHSRGEVCELAATVCEMDRGKSGESVPAGDFLKRTEPLLREHSDYRRQMWN